MGTYGWGGITLGDWYGGLHGREGSGVLGGYFASLGGRMQNPGAPKGRLGLGPTIKVVFHGRVKGGVSVAESWSRGNERAPRASCLVAGTRTLATGVVLPGTLGWRHQSGGPGWWAGQGRHEPRWTGHGDGRLADHRPKWP